MAHRHPLMLRILVACTFFAACLVAPASTYADELVVDNSSPFVQVSGPWTQTALPSGLSGAAYLFRPASVGDATVFWPFPQSAAAGHYEVFARWTSGPNRASNALYWISSEAGTVSVTRNQQSNGGSWQSLGNFDF